LVVVGARGPAYARPPREEALVDLDKALSLDADFRPARLNRGVANWLAGDVTRALDDFDRVLDRRTKSGWWKPASTAARYSSSRRA
jgi:hypothetical protein